MKPKYALSIRQPWAWLIAKGLKDVENRTWSLAKAGFHAPQRIYVHAGQRLDGDNQAEQATVIEDVLGRLLHMGKESAARGVENLASRESYRRWYGAIIGEVDITGCVTKSDSPWFSGPYGFTLANPVLYEKPIPCKGKLGFFVPVFAGE